eukprot:TRINITY_DN777_c0_g1_i1.p1 TRINITY_DN777_c0_g1~~TRINITY_DN777_c0_g1_i1.p1  ORF type:complete len:179 (-),score=73.11 TRINITY_DN777_c0_g1_i1:93-629(-)
MSQADSSRIPHSDSPTRVTSTQEHTTTSGTTDSPKKLAQQGESRHKQEPPMHKQLREHQQNPSTTSLPKEKDVGGADVFKRTSTGHPQQQIKLEGGSVGDVFTSAPAITAVGAGVLGALGYGLYKSGSGGSATTANQMMRFRVLGQAAVVAMVVAIPIYGYFTSQGPSSNNNNNNNRK